MDISEAKNRYNDLGQDQKTDFLIRFSHALTKTGRECYEFDGDGVKHPKLLRYINEMQHRIMGAAMHIRLRKPEEETRDWIVELMLKHDNALLKDRSVRAFEDSISAVSSQE